MTVKRAVRIALLTLISILFSSPSLVQAQSLFSTEHVLQLYNKILYGESAADSVAEKTAGESAFPFIDKLINLGRTFLGKPYRYRGPSPWPMDCSGYVSYLYSKFDIKLPRGAAAQSQYTNPIEREDVRPGDLLFFKGRNARSNRIGHVALVVSVDEDDITMMHSRNSRGIVIEKLNRSAYFSRRLVSYGRIPGAKRVIPRKS
ncbi:hydrolase Nlp/P60 [Porphyromonas gingivalis SJD2]|uniref:C40 family peptidase n=1 Tax=Porphyromonas gingivalis TaxID=837 RepID=UPI0003D1AA29|nr:C40 family peptidase [Porphyromonas gingivalis]ETA27257.1 hydrolase Nlp/P60 [Porphyromonas gingivalis SJD2]OWR75634.1 hydrolase Nlp/P60 [Porphyromonas gingivalis SJD5]